MHEMALMAGVFDVINQSIAPYPKAKVTRVTLVVGALTNAVPDALELAFEAYSRATPAENAVLEIQVVPLTLKCTECHFEGVVGDGRFICPECGSWQVEVIAGRELLIKSLEVETDGD